MCTVIAMHWISLFRKYYFAYFSRHTAHYNSFSIYIKLFQNLKPSLQTTAYCTWACPCLCLGMPNRACPITCLGWINLWQARLAAWACPIGHAQVEPHLLVSVPLAWAVLWQAQVLPKLPNHESGKLLTGRSSLSRSRSSLSCCRWTSELLWQ